MSINNKWFGFLLCFIGIQTSFAEPPFEVLRSCMDLEKNTPAISMKNIDNGYYISSIEKNCEEHYEIKFDNQKYGSERCNEIAYLIINGGKIKLASAVNLSINPEIKPEILYPDTSAWYKIDFNNQSYLCITGAVSESGAGAAVNQYYLVENAFSDNTTPVIYYYFFNKNIIPITSEHF